MYSFLKFITYSFLSAFCFLSLSDVSIQSGGVNTWSESSGGTAKMPAAKITYITNTVVTEFRAQCISTNTRWGGRNILKADSTHIVTGIPVVVNLGGSDKIEYLALEFPAKIVDRRSASETWRADNHFSVSAYRLAQRAWSDNYRNPDNRLTTTNCESDAGEDDIYKISTDGNFISLCFSGYPIKRIDNRAQIFKQRAGSATPSALTLYQTIGLRDRPGSGSYAYTASDDGSGGLLNIDLYIPTLARNTGCRTYTSPLMVFFDEKRPEFMGLTKFPLVHTEYVTWPEKNSPGYFVALDQDGDKQITQAYELFGNAGVETEYDNGFESLKTLDSNKDGRIDLKDKKFSQLVLWKDLNMNGKGEAEEQLPLHQKIKSISLKYIKSEKKYGKRAKEVEKSTFVFADSKGKEQVGEIIDLWFRPIPSQNVIAKKPSSDLVEEVDSNISWLQKVVQKVKKVFL